MAEAILFLFYVCGRVKFESSARTPRIAPRGVKKVAPKRVGAAPAAAARRTGREAAIFFYHSLTSGREHTHTHTHTHSRVHARSHLQLVPLLLRAVQLCLERLPLPDGILTSRRRLLAAQCQLIALSSCLGCEQLRISRSGMRLRRWDHAVGCRHRGLQ